MEATRLSEPPDWLERIVLLAIPPAARESVAGDLWETYREPRQYAAEAFRTVPFVVASQVRRNLNLPAILLQGALIFVAAIGLSASAKQQDTSVVTGFFWTIIGVPLLLIMPMRRWPWCVMSPSNSGRNDGSARKRLS